MKKIAIFGGAFNPIHQGHINLALQFDARIKFDRILLIPTNISPHKDSSQLISGEHRLQMCRLVAEHYERFEVSEIELRRVGKSFTIDTVHALMEQYPDDKLYLIVGSDMFLSLESWRCATELMQLVTICAAAREANEYGALIKKQRDLDTKHVKTVVCEIEALPVSSTILRDRIRQDLPVGNWIPDYMMSYIRRNGLYKTRRLE